MMAFSLPGNKTTCSDRQSRAGMRQAFGIPATWKVVAMMPMGYPPIRFMDEGRWKAEPIGMRAFYEDPEKPCMSHIGMDRQHRCILQRRYTHGDLSHWTVEKRHFLISRNVMASCLALALIENAIERLDYKDQIAKLDDKTDKCWYWCISDGTDKEEGYDWSTEQEVAQDLYDAYIMYKKEGTTVKCVYSLSDKKDPDSCEAQNED